MKIQIPKDLFHDSDEQVKALMGQNYLTSILDGGGLSNTAVVLTNKRLYQMGVIYNENNGIIKKTSGRQVLGIENVTGISVRTIKKTNLKIGGIAFAVLGTLISAIGMFSGSEGFAIVTGSIFFYLGVGCLVAYFITAGKFVSIDYAGGQLLSKCSQYSENEIHNFQKTVSKVKEDYKKNEREMNNRMYAPPAQTNVYAEIEKLNDLKIKGIITEEEFEKKKTELLGL